ncbi:uncharacterized protein MYCFIDRAFT_210860 [Pseudocercospora fijiensis CIRAD86]|uniref:Uncharacterized protein n=1 Tax=Pseudocercospora fijiensis (strain CIRAD86) TaxID=383855 RepID=M3AIE9_PSEFD|nr:uncharacterized protein MYCFIDRAFT_210860 [Pseudocercospora fijiensis CIRAD86]EME84366.1 hypothetical protein MYCFIDRAFT_210860 [Pseudocercospora fijiensis CIRAD86]
MSSKSSSINTSPSTSPLLTSQSDPGYFLVKSSASPHFTDSKLTSTTKSSQSIRSVQRLLMPDVTPPQDAFHLERQRCARRRIKSFVFEDVHLDWKAAPTLYEDHPFEHKVLEMHLHLRCNASRSYLYQVRDDLRRLQTPISVSTNESGVLIIDGEEIVDMIG